MQSINLKGNQILLDVVIDRFIDFNENLGRLLERFLYHSFDLKIAVVDFNLPSHPEPSQFDRLLAIIDFRG